MADTPDVIVDRLNLTGILREQKKRYEPDHGLFASMLKPGSLKPGKMYDCRGGPKADVRSDAMQNANDHEAPELVTIRQFGDMSEALLAQACLDSAGIESFLTDANIARIDWPLARGMSLQVEAADAPAAIEMLQQPPGADLTVTAPHFRRKLAPGSLRARPRSA